MLNVLNKLENLIEELENTTFSKEKELEFFKNKIKTDKGIRIESLLDYENSDFIIALLKIRYKDISIDEIAEDVYSLEGIDDDHIELDVLGYACSYLDRLDSDFIIAQIEKEKLYYSFLDYCEETFFPKDFITTRVLYLQNQTKFNKLARFFIKYREVDPFDVLLQAYNCVPIINADLVGYILSLGRNGNLDNIINTKSIKKLEKRKDALLKLMEIAEEGILDDVVDNVCNISDVINDFNKYLSQLESAQRNEMRDKNKKITQYKELINKLKNSNKILENDVDFITDEDLKQQIIIAMLEKNKNNYLNLLVELKTNQKSEINELDKLLAKHKFVINDVVDKGLVAGNVELNELKDKLKFLSNKYFEFLKKNETNLVKVLLFATVESIEKIVGWLDKQIITKEFLIENIEIMLCLSEKKEQQELIEKLSVKPKFDILNSNIELFKKNNICLPNIKKYDINLFLKESDSYIKLFTLLKKYNLNLNDTNLVDFSIFENSEPLNMIDSLIEIDMYDYLKEHIQLINKDKNMVKRILLMKNIGFSVFDENNSLINIVAEGNGFYVSNDSLNDYLVDDTPEHMNLECYFELESDRNDVVDENIINDPLIFNLENNFKLDDNRYNFDGIIISRNKVLRCMTTLNNYCFEKGINNREKLISSILFNSILDEDSINKIIDNIDKTLVDGRKSKIKNKK